MKGSNRLPLIYLLLILIPFISTELKEKFNFKRDITADNNIACNHPYLNGFVFPGDFTVGRIVSPGYATEAYYPQNASCIWVITAPSDKRIIVFIDPSDFGLDLLKKAVLSFYNGNDETPFIELRAKLTVSQRIVSVGSRLRIKFQGVDEPRAKGFELYFEHITPPTECEPPLMPCRNKMLCYNGSQKCDKTDDCLDGTDEQECSSLTAEDFPQGCGRPQISPSVHFGTRIVGGEKVIPGSWPWMVSIRYKSTSPISHLCGAALINRSWLVTAGHCFTPLLRYEKYEVHLGRFNSIVTITGKEVFRYIDKIFVHRSFSPLRTNRTYDIALVKLNSPVPMDNNFVQPICMADEDSDIAENSSAYVIGWGNNNPNNEDLFLKQAGVPIISREKCKNQYKDQLDISDNVLCAGRMEGGADSCDGDSGGPLMVYNSTTSRWVLIGIVSTGSEVCGQRGKPGVYTNVASFRAWIDTIIEEN